MKNHAAISNPYFMEQAPKHMTPIEIQVNGKRAVCHRCGPVRVKVLKSFYLGKIATDKRDEAGDRVYLPGSIKLCSVCNSVIQSPVPVEPPKKVTPAEGKVNPKVYALLAHLIQGEREGWKLARMLEVCQSQVWTYLWELQRSGLVTISKEGRYCSLKKVVVTEEGLHHFDVEGK